MLLLNLQLMKRKMKMGKKTKKKMSEQTYVTTDEVSIDNKNPMIDINI